MCGFKIWVTLLLILVGDAVIAAPTGRDTFLSHGPGAAEAAMGEAVAATVTGPQSLYYNVAGLAHSPSAISGEWSRLLPGISYSWLGSAVDVKFARIGLGLINLDLGNITGRASLNDTGYSVSSYQRAYLLGTSRQVAPGLVAGTTLGLLDYNLAGYRSSAYFSDTGISYFLSQRLNVALVIKNAYFSGLNFGGGKEIYPKDIRLGGAYNLGGFVISSQVNKVMDGSNLQFAIGGSYSLYNMLALRAGFNGYPRFGLGFTTKNRLLAIDLSYEAQAISASERVTMSYFFLPSEPTGPKDAFDDMKDRGESLNHFLTEEAKRALEQKRDYDAINAFEKLMALEPSNRDTARALSALSGREYSAVPEDSSLLKWWGKQKQKAYLRFSVAYAEGYWEEACSVARNYVDRWPKDRKSGLIVSLLSDKGCALPKETPAKRAPKSPYGAAGVFGGLP